MGSKSKPKAPKQAMPVLPIVPVKSFQSGENEVSGGMKRPTALTAGILTASTGLGTAANKAKKTALGA